MQGDHANVQMYLKWQQQICAAEAMHAFAIAACVIGQQISSCPFVPTQHNACTTSRPRQCGQGHSHEKTCSRPSCGVGTVLQMSSAGALGCCKACLALDPAHTDVMAIVQTMFRALALASFTHLRCVSGLH